MAVPHDSSVEQLASSILTDVRGLGSSTDGDALRRETIIQAARRIIREVSEPMDLVKDTWVAVRW